MQPLSSSDQGQKAKGGFWKFAIVFLGIILLGYLTFIAVFTVRNWDQIKANRELDKKLEAWADIYRNDKAGGQTPDETIELFIAALEKNDVELATSYFMPDDYGNRDKERAMMQETFEAGYFPQLADGLRRAEPDPDGIIGDKFYRFTSYDEDGSAIGSVSLQYNGNVWKIEHF